MEVNCFTILYWFCHTSTWICHRYTRVAPHPETPSHLPPHTIPLGRLSAPALSIQYHASNLNWLFISYMILYKFHYTYMAYSYHLSKFHIYALAYCIGAFLSGLLHSVSIKHHFRLSFLRTFPHFSCYFIHIFPHISCYFSYRVK